MDRPGTGGYSTHSGKCGGGAADCDDLGYGTHVFPRISLDESGPVDRQELTLGRNFPSGHGS